MTIKNLQQCGKIVVYTDETEANITRKQKPQNSPRSLKKPCTSNGALTKELELLLGMHN
jgi:hypothetical protein